MKNEIAFIYAPYIHFEAYKFAIENLRKHYQDSDVFIYFESFREDVEKYKKVADEHNCKFILREEKVFFTNKFDSIDINIKKMFEIQNRLIYSCENTNAEWMMIFEDDVLIKKKIENFPKADVGTCRNYFRPGGGAVFKRNVYLDSIKKVDVLNIITTIPDAHWAADVLLQNILSKTESSFEEWYELAEPNHRDNIEHSVYHGYKQLYNNE